VLPTLKAFHEDLQQYRLAIRSVTAAAIAQKALRSQAEAIGARWCNELGPKISATNSFAAEMLTRYTDGFSRLIALSSPNNRKSTYLSVLDDLLKSFRKDLILPIQQGKVRMSSGNAAFDAFLAKISASDEGEYFKEALSCAKQGYLRAATVMGWCTAVDRIHRKIEEIGFATFNVTSAQMASQTTGRFKRFNQSQNVNSLSELREVFDTIILWIVEGMGLIDSNQHTRLRSCFEMRCQAAHPGDAPTTDYNLLSFFSDIDQIVLVSPRFALKSSSKVPEGGGTG
jgi:hypothetical protein